MEHPEKDIIKWEKIGGVSRFTPGQVEALNRPLVVLGGINMHLVTSRGVHSTKGVTQERPKASDSRVPLYILDHPSEPNLLFSIKLQGGIELLNQSWTIILLESH
jgi:hypothetical protein